ncbi:MAG: lactoylglutathione lyase family protein [Oscillospiraceae bacterium]|nr:lactoylglutathione lyase family protein [Oscillospiraceae bacterium]
MSVYPRVFSHIGLSVPDLDVAVKFYSEVLGFYVIMPPSTIKRDDSDVGIMCDDCFGKDWTEFRIAHLATADGIGIELFEFANNTPREPVFNYWRTGLFHFGVQDPDIESLVASIVAHGGKQRMPIRYYYKDAKPYRMCYVEDPFGNVFEVYSHSYELTYSAGEY